MLLRQELPHSEDESGRDKYCAIDVHAYQERQDQKLGYTRPGGSEFGGGQDEENQIEMAQKVMRRCIDAQVRRCERLAIDGLRRGRGTPKKYQKEIFRQDMV